MTPEQNKLVLELFDRLSEAGAPVRDDELAKIDDPEVREAVERLLLADAHDTLPLDHPRVSEQLRGEVAATSESPQHEDRIGPYKVVREIGKGGLGYVLLAFREDDQFRKRVAIKLVKKGMDTDEILRRFKQERQVLSALQHPNIARVFDAGTTSDGRPYFAMQYIEGVPIDEYCDDQGLTTVERLKLFSKVCAAVHYAHQNQIVHRDIKPSNILVTPDGEPHLLDFGIAKLLNPDLFGSPNTTGPEFRLMTPEFASPEQVEGKPITTVSDVYSLGVLLYLILTGHPPYRLHTRIREEVARIVCNVEPERPSTAISRVVEMDEAQGTKALSPADIARNRDGQISRLRRRLAGDIDNIVLMAMRKKPPRRYSSAEQFAADIQRHLDGKPVIARPETWWYVTGKFIGRNRVFAGTAAAILAMLIIGSIVIFRFAQIARTERDAARRSESEARALTEQLISAASVLEWVDADRGLNKEEERRLRERSLNMLVLYSESAQKALDADPSSTSKKRALAAGIQKHADVLAEMQRTDEALDRYARAAMLYREVAKSPEHNNEDSVQAGWAELRRASLLQKSQPTSPATYESFDAAFGDLENALKLQPGNVFASAMLSLGCRNLGFQRLKNGQYPQAVKLLERAAALIQAGDRKKHKVLAALAQAYEKVDERAKARAAQKEALAFYQSLEHPDAEDDIIAASLEQKLSR